MVWAVEEGALAWKVAVRFAIGASAAIKLVCRVRPTSSTAPAKTGGCRTPLLAGQWAFVGGGLVEVLQQELRHLQTFIPLFETRFLLAAYSSIHSDHGRGSRVRARQTKAMISATAW